MFASNFTIVHSLTRNTLVRYRYNYQMYIYIYFNNANQFITFIDVCVGIF